MAIYHLSVKPIQRSKNRSATAAAAYRAGEKIVDERTGEVHDYTRKRGVEHAEIVTPPGCDWMPTRAQLWNAAERAEKRKDGTPAREHEIALPKELDADQRRQLVRAYAVDLSRRHGCAVDFAIHAPAAGDNWHAHVLCSTRKVEGHGLGAKCDREQAGRNRADDLTAERERWAELANAALEHAGISERIDHRSHADRGLDDLPTTHLGPAATQIERRGQRSRAGDENARRASVNRRRRSRETAVVEAEVELLKAKYDLDTMKIDREAQQEVRGWQREIAEKRQSRMSGKGLSDAPIQQLDRYLPRNEYRVYDHPGRTVVFLVNEKTTVIDKGDRLTCGRGAGDNPTAKQIDMMCALAGAKGWRSVNLTGSDDFKRRAVAELARRRIAVENPELQAAWQAVRAELDTPATPDSPPRRELVGVRGRWTPPAPAPKPEPIPAPPPPSDADLLAQLKDKLTELTGHAVNLREDPIQHVSGVVIAANERWAVMHIGRETQLVDCHVWPVKEGRSYQLKEGGWMESRPVDNRAAAALEYVYGQRVGELAKQWAERDTPRSKARSRGNFER